MSVVAGQQIDSLFSALSEELHSRGVGMLELCVIGGSALALMGLVERPTKDVDVVALGDSAGATVRIRDAQVLPDVLLDAVAVVGDQFGVGPGWLNNGPARLMEWGLPEGFESRLTSIPYGTALRVHVASRFDQICFKTYAAADVAGRHVADLVSLSPTRDEMGRAFAWTLQQDSSPGFLGQLQQMADYLEVRDVLDALSR